MGVDAFEVDSSTPHPGILIIDGTIASRETNGGWVTLRSATPLTNERRQWAIKILDQGEGADGSGLMLGVLPKLSLTQVASMGTKYISELGGWCLSRAGDSYGVWKCEKMPFATGSVVEFEWDPSCKTLHIVCGVKKAVGHIGGVSEDTEFYPAFSMYYLNQKVIFV